MSVPNNILTAIVNGLRKKLKLTADQCYPSIAPAYVEGQPERVLQVCPSGVSQDGGGHGNQLGGALGRRQMVRLTMWWRVHMDMHGHSEQALIEAEEGLLDFFEQADDVLAHTYLGDLLVEPIRYESETAPEWAESPGVVRQDRVYSVKWIKARPKEITLTAADVA